MSITGGGYPRAGGCLEFAVHWLTIQVTLVVLLVGFQGIVLVLEHHLSNSRGVHVDTIQGTHHTAQLLKGGDIEREQLGLTVPFQ